MSPRFRNCPHCQKKLTPCGTISSYSMGCRCDVCKASKNVYERERYLKGIKRKKKAAPVIDTILPGGV